MYRPTALKEFVGQSRLVEQLEVSMSAARKQNKELPHILLYGPRGTGKTTLSNIVANHANGKLVEVSPFSLKTEEDLFRMFHVNLRGDEHTVFLIDEIHRLPAKTAELLYQPMERYTIIVGGRLRRKPMAYRLMPFTIIGATTNPGDLPEPFRDRFGLILAMEYYTEEEMVGIIGQAAARQNYPLTEEASSEIVKRSRNNPRLANTYLDRCNDYRLVVTKSATIDLETAIRAFDQLGVNNIGLTSEDLDYLGLLHEAQRPVGLSNLGTAMGLDDKTLAETIEPFLVQKGLVIITPSGRTLSDAGIIYFLSQAASPGMHPL